MDILGVKKKIETHCGFTNCTFKYRHPDLIDAVIRLIMQDRDIKSSKILTWQDLFYKDVSTFLC